MERGSSAFAQSADDDEDVPMDTKAVSAVDEGSGPAA